MRSSRTDTLMRTTSEPRDIHMRHDNDMQSSTRTGGHPAQRQRPHELTLLVQTKCWRSIEVRRQSIHNKHACRTGHLSLAHLFERLTFW
jgi:hypothetical protein